MTCLCLPHLPGSFMHWSVGWSSRSHFPEWSRLTGEILRHLSHEADLEVPCRFHHCPCKASATIEWVQITGPPASLWWLTPPPHCCLTVGNWVPDLSSSFSPASMFCTSQSSAVLLLCCLVTVPLPVVCLVLSFSLKTRAWSCPPWQYSLNHLSCHWIRHSYLWTYSQMIDHGLFQRPRARVTQEGLHPPGRAQITSPLPWVWISAWTKAGGHLALERRPRLVAKSLLTAQSSTPVPGQV